jgi:hypothetical protein
MWWSAVYVATCLCLLAYYPARLMYCFYWLATHLSTPAGPDQHLTSMLVLLISLMCSRSAIHQSYLLCQQLL